MRQVKLGYSQSTMNTILLYKENWTNTVKVILFGWDHNQSTIVGLQYLELAKEIAIDPTTSPWRGLFNFRRRLSVNGD
jgi:hypothetical protein